MEEAQPAITEIGLGDAYAAAEAALPGGWRLDGLRCQSTGLRRHERSDEWRAVATGPAGTVIEGRAEQPLDALADVLRRLELVTGNRTPGDAPPRADAQRIET